MITPEELMTKFANKHSYKTWDELMYDSHAHSQIEYTRRVMLIYARIVRCKKCGHWPSFSKPVKLKNNEL